MSGNLDRAMHVPVYICIDDWVNLCVYMCVCIGCTYVYIWMYCVYIFMCLHAL